MASTLLEKLTASMNGSGLAAPAHGRPTPARPALTPSYAGAATLVMEDEDELEDDDDVFGDDDEFDDDDGFEDDDEDFLEDDEGEEEGGDDDEDDEEDDDDDL